MTFLNKKTLTAEDRLEIVETLYRLGAGIDENSAAHFEKAFAKNAVIDFGPAARFMGIDFPLLSGRDAIIGALTSSVGLLDTTHVVTNPLIEMDGDAVVMKAIVEAAHFPPGDHSRRCVMKNRYRAELRQEGGRWRLSNVVVNCAWFDGDPNVLLGK